MTPEELEKFFNEAAPDAEHGFQREAGFVIDEVEGNLFCLVVKCHSDAHPEPEKRFLMKVPTNDPTATPLWRCHDYGAIKRRHGKQCVHDRWTLKLSAVERFFRWCSEQIETYSDVILSRLGEILRRKTS